jgi:hypothetical protein
MAQLPERTPVTDEFAGVLIELDDQQVLATELPDDEIPFLLGGTLIIRYGLRYLEKPHLSIVPGLLVLDYGDMLTGEEAWDFIQKRSNLHPRAEVFGYRNDGVDDSVAVKGLDLALTPEVLVYTAAADTTPAARPTALIAPSDAELPQRLAAYLPRFESLAAWKARNE